MFVKGGLRTVRFIALVFKDSTAEKAVAISKIYTKIPSIFLFMLLLPPLNIRFYKSYYSVAWYKRIVKIIFIKNVIKNYKTDFISTLL